MPEGPSRLSRRELFAQTSKVALAGALAGGRRAEAAEATEKPASQPAGEQAKVLNFHPKMRYRRLGKTGLMLSEVSLGGHWKDRNGARYWDLFSNDEVPADVAKNRTEIVSAAIEAGINYVDITTAAECLSYGAALKGRREKFLVGADDHRLGPRAPENRNVPRLVFDVEECLRRLKTDYLDVWRASANMDGTNSESDVELMVEAAEKCKKAGKIRHFGISSHHREWLSNVVEKFPQVEMIIFPCSAITKKAGEPVTKANVVEKAGWDNATDFRASLFELARRRDVGVVTIKPFAGGSLFTSGGKFPVMGVGLKEENDLARLTLQCILTKFEEITAVVPGLTTVYEVDNAARASYTRGLAMSPADRLWLQEASQQAFANLPPQYRWLREWDVA